MGGNALKYKVHDLVYSEKRFFLMVKNVMLSFFICIYYYCVCVCWARVPIHGVEVKGQLLGVAAFLPLWFRGLNSGPLLGWQALYLLSYLTHNVTFVFNTPEFSVKK